MNEPWVLFVVALLAAWALGYLGRWLGPRVKMMDIPDAELKPHAHPVSLLGGVAVAGGLVAGLLARSLSSDMAAAQALPRWGAIAAFAGAFLLGLVDDRRGVPPLIRFVLELGLGMLVAFVLPAVALPGAILAYIVAAVLFVAVLNGVNMVDGMDGLAASLAVVSAIGMSFIGFRASGLIVIVVTAGAALGFLFHNWPPARLFLGDSGAYTLGAALAISILAHGRTPQTLAGGITCLGIFALDLGLAVLRRVFGGVPLMKGDRGHFYDQLMQRGRTAKATLTFCLLLQGAFVVMGVAISRMHESKLSALAFVVFWALVGVLLALKGFVRAKPGATSEEAGA